MNMYKMTWTLMQQFSEHDAMHNAVYESHVLHLRNLIHFFNCASIKPDDIIISRVLIEHSGYSLKTEPIFRDMINKSVQHLTTYRADELDKEALSNEINKMYPKICTRIELFESDIRVSGKLKDEYVRDYKRYMKESGQIPR